MKRVVRSVAIVALGFALMGAVAYARPWDRPGAKPGASGAASAQAKPPEEVAASGLRLKGRSLATRVHAVGSLVANESVTVVPEVSRRVVKIGFPDGAEVKQGDVLFELDDADLRAKLGQLGVKRKVLADVVARKKRLLAEGLTTQADYDDAKGALDLADAEAGPLGVELARTKIKAPFAGRLGLRSVSVGAMVSPATKLVTLEDESKLKIDFSVPERYAAAVRPGNKLRFRVDGRPGEEALEATVSASETAVDEGTRSLRVRAVTERLPGLLAGLFVTVELDVSTDGGALLVPSEAVIPSLGGHSLFRFKDGAAEAVPVEIGLRTEREVQIVKGVSAGDVILVSNLLRLRPGAKVKLGEVAE